MLDGLLPAMRDTVERTLSTSITLRVRSRSRSASGGSTYTWADGATVTGRFMAVSHSELEADYAAKMGISASHVAVLPYDTAIDVDDRIKVGGVEYEVTGIMEHEVPVLVKALCARVTS